MKKINAILILACAAILLQCSTPRNLEKVNMAHLYHEDGVILKPLFKIFHSSADSSTIFFEGSTDQLLYRKNQDSKKFEAHLGIRYKLFANYQREAILDSGNIEITDETDEIVSSIMNGEFQISTQNKTSDNSYVLEVILTDRNRNLSYFNVLFVDKSNANNEQYFLATTTNNRPIYRQQHRLNTPFFLKHQSGAKKLTVRYYNRDFPLAATPYSDNKETSFSYDADSIFTVDAASPITLKKHGFYHFLADDSQKKGYTIFCFSNTFPYITNREDLGPPLRYLTTQSEFNKINNEDEFAMKLEVDKFWLKLAGTPDRGKMMISNYYNRVEAANKHFTSYLEGWKTDRGIVYIILGPPTTVTKNNLQETWVYGDPNSSLNYVFTFTKLRNPFTTNDYALIRKSSYRYGWAKAIESWRNGRIFGIQEIKRAQDERDRQTRVNTPPYFWY